MGFQAPALTSLPSCLPSQGAQSTQWAQDSSRIKIPPILCLVRAPMLTLRKNLRLPHPASASELLNAQQWVVQSASIKCQAPAPTNSRQRSQTRPLLRCQTERNSPNTCELGVAPHRR